MVASSQPLGSRTQKSEAAEGARLRFLGGVFLGAFLGLAAAAWLGHAHLLAGRMPLGVEARAAAPLRGVSSMSGQGAGDRTGVLGALATEARLDVMASVDRAILRTLHDAGSAGVPAYRIPEALASGSSASSTGMSFR